MDVDILEKIEAVGSKLVKEQILAGASAELRLFLEQCLDPDITYGVTCDEDATVRMWTRIDKDHPPGPRDHANFWKKMRKLLADLAARRLTGLAASRSMLEVLSGAPDAISIKWATRFINKNLRAGFDVRTYNSVFGDGTVVKFAVQLADNYEGERLAGVWYVQPKLDGNRVIFIDGKARSRNGKEYPNCQHIIDLLLGSDPKFFEKWVLDGEMMGDLGFDKSSGALRRETEKGRKKAMFTYWIFDLIDRSEWERRMTKPLKARLHDLSDVVGTKFEPIRLVPTRIFTSPTHERVMGLCDEYIAAGFEGAMLKNSESPYVFKRAKNLLKVKKFHDADLAIVDFYEGKGRHKKRLGGIIVRGMIDGQMCNSRVGSGFDDALREEIWTKRADWLGAIVQVQYQDLTDDGSLRFPVFMTRRNDKE